MVGETLCDVGREGDGDEGEEEVLVGVDNGRDDSDGGVRGNDNDRDCDDDDEEVGERMDRALQARMLLAAGMKVSMRRGVLCVMVLVFGE